MSLSDLEVRRYLLQDTDYSRRIFDEIVLDARIDEDEFGYITRWAIIYGGSCLSKEGHWEYEPQPSSRTDEFIKRCRWSTAKEAYEFWLWWVVRL